MTFRHAGEMFAKIVAGISPPRAESDANDCVCSEHIRPGEYFHCPICDREWMPEDDEPRVPGTPREEEWV